MSITALIDHILTVHHAFCHDEMPQLRQDIERSRPDLFPLWDELYGVLQEHLWKEEQILFPMAQRVAAGGGFDLRGPVRQMQAEHDALMRSADALRAAIRSGAADRVTDRIVRFLADLDQHAHTEDHELFPAVIAGANVAA